MAAAAQPKIFKKIEVIEGGGHHGGGWKVAYADFMTAMMAFFLLMWILASSDEAKLRGIAEYFTNATMPGGSGILDGATLGPPGTLTASNGSVVARGSELGKIDDPSPAKWEIRDVTPTSDPKEKVLGSKEGDHEHPAAADAAVEFSESGKEGTSDGTGGQDAAMAEVRKQDDSQFEELRMEIQSAMQANPDLKDLQANVIFEKTPDGLQILIVDQDGKPMFHSGRAEMAGATKTLMNKLGQSLANIPNRMVLSGHTDAVRFADSTKYDNWDLSSDRANATRRVFEGSGVNRARIIRVSGLADTQLLVPANPKDPTNRRISILVQYRQKADMAPAPMVKEAKADMPAPKMDNPAPVKDHAETKSHSAQETKHAADHTAPEPSPLGDQVFQHLRSALR
ncbi:flagellar motor protein MotB [Sulfitobacter mediterraneus]|uniref:Chemotaxis protein MotB n=1 Tax=Sulfitobacter mediterraneus TaxID=83219 RepID=A0A2T6CA04_9RHOB|nr:flagellar motor protein MotB [Sulfitobacter mediterraneus]KIN77124.1 Flagellar motor rotation protein MotB [Sulfitobacter mediterraneus KCTC 32188]PTX65106.1 chemotaxis protein MotB [Sulfitobacter mediterraneus]